MLRALLCAIALFVATTPARAADWWRAETDHFILYSRTDEQQTRAFAEELERFDRALRVLRGLPTNEVLAPVNKLTIYQYGQPKNIGYLAIGKASGIAGFYIPRAGSSVAFVPALSKDFSEPREILFHEYAHRFMFQHAAAAYPAWYVEGYAELHSTLELLDTGGFRLGAPPASRADMLWHLGRYPIEKLFAPPPVDKRDWEDAMQVYSRGFSLAHLLTFSKERSGQLSDYLTRLNQGVDGLEAARQAFGDLKALQSELNRYQYQKGRGIQVEMERVPVTLDLRALRPDEEALIMLEMKQKRGVTPAQARDLVGDARRLLGEYPDSLPVLLAGIEAEYDAENLAEAQALATRALARDERLSGAHYYLGLIEQKRGEEDVSRLAIARQHFTNAAIHDRADPKPLFQYFETFLDADEDPPEDARIALETAYSKAQFAEDIRARMVDLMLREQRQREALALLGPLTYNAHDPEGAAEMRAVYEIIEKGDLGEAQAKLATIVADADADEAQGGG